MREKYPRQISTGQNKKRLNKMTDQPSKTSPLLERIRAAKKKRAVKKSVKKQRASSAGLAMALMGASALVSSVLVGLALGAGIDFLLGTKPFAMVLMAMFGIAAGLLSVIRQATKLQVDETASKQDIGTGTSNQEG